jgi:hypothetical protein
MGRQANPAGETLRDLLSHRCVLYQERDKLQVIRLRSYIMVTMSDIGVPRSAVPLLLDSLAFVDERSPVLEVGAAVRAAGSLGSCGRQFAPYLLALLSERYGDEEFSLDSYCTDFSRHQATTVHLEVVRALGLMCSNQDQTAAEILRHLAENSTTDGLDSRVQSAARLSLDAMRNNAW